MNNKIPILLTLLVALFIVPSTVSATQFHPFLWFCETIAGNYTVRSPYEGNLNRLFRSLVTNQASVALFGHDSAGMGVDEAFMIYNCRGDLTFQDCQDCVSQAAKTVVAQCPNQKEALMWYEECTLRYSNRTLYNREEELPAAWDGSGTNVSDPVAFDKVLVDVFDGLIKEAAYNESKGGYAIGERDLPPSVVTKIPVSDDKVYSLAQCTPDILGTRCERCLRAALSLMSGCCGAASDGFQMYTPSCQVRYSIVPFIPGTGLLSSPVNSSSSPPFPPSASPNDNSSSSPPFPLSASPNEGAAAVTMIKLDGEFFILGILIALGTFFIMRT